MAAAVRDAQSGDPAAVRRLLAAIAPTVRRTCARVLGAGHPELQDAMQESLHALVKGLPQYRFGGTFHGYVATIALRKAIEVKRATLKRWQRADRFGRQLEGQPPATSTDSLVDGLTLVRRILERPLGPPTEALLMRLVLGMSIEEIAAATGVTPSAVKTRLRRGKDNLRLRGGTAKFWRRLLSSGKPGENQEGKDDGERAAPVHRPR